MVIREDRDGGGRMSSLMQRFPGLGHQPDILLEGLAATRAWQLHDLGDQDLCESAGDTFITHRHTATSRGAAHRFLEQTLLLARPVPCQPTTLQGHPVCGCSPLSSASAAPWAPRHRPSSGRSLPGWRGLCLTGCSTRRAGPRKAVCAPLFRSAITFAARRALAAGILRMCVFSANLLVSTIKGKFGGVCAQWHNHSMRRPNNHSTTLGQLADPVLHFGFIQDADYTVVIPSSLAFHAAKEAKIRARLLPNERRFPPKNPARLREQLTTVHISPHGDAADFHGEFKRLVGLICGFPGRVRLLIGSTDRWWPKHYSRDAVDQLYDASRCPSIVSVRAQNLHAAFLRPQQAKRTGMLPIGLPPLSNWTKLPLSKASPV
jgi:hypothetical protein